MEYLFGFIGAYLGCGFAFWAFIMFHGGFMVNQDKRKWPWSLIPQCVMTFLFVLVLWPRDLLNIEVR